MQFISNWSLFDGLFLALLTVLPLLFLQRRLHHELMVIFLLITRQLNVSLIFYTLLFFPGVALHELSHWLMAGMLRVPTGKVKLIPEWSENGNLRMGSVEAARTDVVRDSLIGAAPLIFGGLFVGYAGVFQLQLYQLWDFLGGQDGPSFWAILQSVYSQPDFWLWFYLLFVVSSTMLPSAADRHAWRPALLIVGVLLVTALVAGAGPWMLANLAPGLNEFLRSVAAVFGMSAATHAVLLVPLWVVRRLLNRITGLQAR